jgi:hypothetical protein
MAVGRSLLLAAMMRIVSLILGGLFWKSDALEFAFLQHAKEFYLHAEAALRRFYRGSVFRCGATRSDHTLRVRVGERAFFVSKSSSSSKCSGRAARSL